jgi:hypothetical protein
MLRVDVEVDKFMLNNGFKHEFCSHWIPLLQRIFPQADIIIDVDEFDGIECVSACLFMRVFSERWLLERLLQYYDELEVRCSKRFMKAAFVRVNPGQGEEE